jgi:hypothetical protein
MIEELDKQLIIELLQKYELPLEVEVKSLWGTRESHIGMLRFPIGSYRPKSVILQVAKLAKQMLSCLEGKTQITCTISNPGKGEVKGTTRTIEFDSHSFNIDLLLFLCNYLDENEMPLRKLMEEGGDAIWSEDELNAVIQYEQSYNLIGKSLIGKRLNYIVNKFQKEWHLFEGWTTTKVYSFLYDWCALQGEVNEIESGVFKGDVGREKFQWVRYCIEAYKKKESEWEGDLRKNSAKK